MRVKVNSPAVSEAAATPIARGEPAGDVSGVRLRDPVLPKGGRPPKGEISGGVCGLSLSGRCPLTGKSASTRSSKGSPTRNRTVRVRETRELVLFSRLNTSTPLRFFASLLAAALRKTAVILFDRLAVTTRRGAFVAEAQVGAAELFAQTLAQLKLKLPQRVYDLCLERSGRLSLAERRVGKECRSRWSADH